MEVKKKVKRNQDGTIYLRLPQEEKEAYLEAAAQSDRNLTDWLRVLARRRLRQMGIVIKKKQS